jgi:hypothetical protein
MITKADKKKYALPTKLDIKILTKIKDLEKEKLNKENKKMLKFIKSQLEYDWRKPLVKELNKIKGGNV